MSTKKPSLIHSWAPKKISILRIRYCQYWKYVPHILLYYKKLKTLKIIRLNFSDFLGDQYKIMMSDCRILYKNEEVLP